MKRSKSRGFTLVEIAVVIAVVGILATMTIVVYHRVQKESRDTKRRNDILIVMKELENYYQKNGEYPTLAGFQAAKMSQVAPKLVDNAVKDPLDNIATMPTGRLGSTQFCVGEPHLHNNPGQSCKGYGYYADNSGSSAIVSNWGTMGTRPIHGSGCSVLAKQYPGPTLTDWYVLAWYSEVDNKIHFIKKEHDGSAEVKIQQTESQSSTIYPTQQCVFDKEV